MEGFVRALVDAPLLRWTSALRRWSFLHTQVPPMALEHHVQGWFRSIVGLSACFLASRFTNDGLLVGLIFFLWIISVHSLALVATRAASAPWMEDVYRAARADAAARRELSLSERISALGMVAVSLALLALFAAMRDVTGAAVAIGMAANSARGDVALLHPRGRSAFAFAQCAIGASTLLVGRRPFVD